MGAIKNSGKNDLGWWVHLLLRAGDKAILGRLLTLFVLVLRATVACNQIMAVKSTLPPSSWRSTLQHLLQGIRVVHKNEQSHLFVPQLAQGDETSPSQQRPLPARSALLPQEGQLQIGLPFLAKHEAAHALGEVHGDALLARVAHLFMSLPPIHSYSGGRWQQLTAINFYKSALSRTTLISWKSIWTKFWAFSRKAPAESFC